MTPKHASRKCLLAAIVALPVCGPAVAEPVHVEHAAGEGSGYSFRRGNACTVVTANHVVQANGFPVAELSVIDRSGGKALGQVTYSNAAYDLALISLPDDPEVACSSIWPAADALAGMEFDGSTRLEAVRHYPDGREALVLLSYAGGTAQELSLAPVDRMNIRESDSGSIVMLDNQPAGIVLRVRTGEDRVDALRFETIDQLVGERFRGIAGERALAFTGVFSSARENPAWSAYVRSWLTDGGGWGVVPADDSAAYCSMQVNVMNWTRATEANAAYADAQETAEKICERGGFLAEQLCKVAQREVEEEPPRLTVHTIMLEASMTSRSGVASSKLDTATYQHDASSNARDPAIELAALQSAVASVAAPMFDSGVCN